MNFYNMIHRYTKNTFILSLPLHAGYHSKAKTNSFKRARSFINLSLVNYFENQHSSNLNKKSSPRPTKAGKTDPIWFSLCKTFSWSDENLRMMKFYCDSLFCLHYFCFFFVSNAVYFKWINYNWTQTIFFGYYQRSNKGTIDKSTVTDSPTFVEFDYSFQ